MLDLASLNELESLEQDLAREQTIRQGFRGFIPHFWEIADPSVFTPNWHVDAMADHLQACFERQIKRLVICIPPRHAKSTTLALFNGYCWVRDPAHSFMNVSYDPGLTTRDAERVLEVLRSSKYRGAFPEAASVKRSVALTNFRTQQGGFRLSTSIRGKATGYGSQIQIFDDPNKASDATSGDAKSPKLLKKVIEAFGGTFATRINGAPEEFVRIVVMQRISAFDLAGYAMDLGYESLILPFRYSPAVMWDCRSSLNFQDPRKEEGEVLFPALWGGDAGKRLEEEIPDQMSRSAQLQQNPTPEAGGFVEKAWLEATYDKFPAQERLLRRVQCWDLSAKGNKTSHSRCAGLLGFTWQGNFYWEGLEVGHWNYPQVKAKFIELQNQPGWSQTGRIWVEDKAGGSSLLDDLGCQRDPDMKLPLVHPWSRKLEPYDPKGRSKEDRVRLQSDKLKQGKLFIKLGATWREMAIAEVTGFPNAPHDDITDVLSMFLELAAGRPTGQISKAAQHA
jgi:phage terminase large subunit-like protein